MSEPLDHLTAYLASSGATDLPAGVLSVIFAEDWAHLPATLDHALAQRPAHVLVIGDLGGLAQQDCVTLIPTDLADRFARDRAMNLLIERFHGRWLHWVTNGEFLFYPWCETRSLGDIATFLEDERREALFSYALDLYAQPMPDPCEDPREGQIFFEQGAYHAFPGEDQRLPVFGGLGWRFEACFQPWWQQIGRPALFKARKSVPIGPDMRFEDARYATVSAPWHHSPTGAVMSLRRSRHLLSNPAFLPHRERLIWPGSQRFNWSSRQLLEQGFIEPGQWF